MAEHIQCDVSSEAKDILRAWKRTQGFTRIGDTLDDLLLEFARMKAEVADAKERANHIDDLTRD